MKKKLFVIALIVLLLSSIGAGTLAYSVKEGTAVNVVTTGGVEIELLETGADGKPFPESGVHGVYPGAVEAKKVWVENVGPNRAWIRIGVEKIIELAKGVEGAVDTGLVKLDIDTENWIDGGDGYFYYKHILAPGQKTAPLFTQVSFDTAMGNLYQNSIAQVNVVAQATQHANNGDSVMDAKGWPENNE